MKIKKEVIAIMNKKGMFLAEYKNDRTLAFNAIFTDKIECAATVPVENFEEQKKEYKHLAKAMHGRLVKVESEYEVRYLNGEEPIIEEEEAPSIEGLINLLKSSFGGE